MEEFEEKCARCHDLEKLWNLSICETSLRREFPKCSFYRKNQITRFTLCDNCLKDHPWNCSHKKALLFKYENATNRIEYIRRIPTNLAAIMTEIQEGAQRFGQTLDANIRKAEMISDLMELNRYCEELDAQMEVFTERFEAIQHFPQFIESLIPTTRQLQESSEMNTICDQFSGSKLDDKMMEEKYQTSSWDHIETGPATTYHDNKVALGFQPFREDKQSTSGCYNVTGTEPTNLRQDQWSRVSYGREKIYSSPHTSGSATPTTQPHPPSYEDDALYTTAPPIEYDYASATYQVENSVRKRWHIKIWGLKANLEGISFRIENKSETPMLIKFEQWTAGIVLRFKGSNDYQEKKEYRRAFELAARQSEEVKIIMTDRVRKATEENYKVPFVRFHGIGRLMGNKYNFVVRTINCHLENDQWKPVEI